VTVLHRGFAAQSLAQALRSMPEGAQITVLSPGEAVLGRLSGQHVMDIASAPPRPAARHRAALDLESSHVFEIRAFTDLVEVTWRSGRTVWASEDLSQIPGQVLVSSVTAAASVKRRAIRAGEYVPTVAPPEDAGEAWSAWANAEIGTRWYPVRPPLGLDPASAVAVLDIIDYTYEIRDGPAKGNVAPLASRWLTLEVVNSREITFPARKL
jgi:hypothetical protein